MRNLLCPRRSSPHPGSELLAPTVIAPIDWQILNLVLIQDALHRWLVGVDLQCGSLHFHYFFLASDLQFDIDSGCVADQHCDEGFYRAKAFSRYQSLVLTWNQRSGIEGART